MSVKPTAKQLEGLADILLEDHEGGPSAAAKAAWKYLAEVYADRARFATIVQIKGDQPEGNGEEVLDTIVLGPYATKGDAESAAQAARYPAGMSIECRAMVVQWNDTTPGEWFKARADKKKKHVTEGADRLLEWLYLRGDLPEEDER